ncbi:FABP family protein [Amycolatopsis antarctica]|uniref:Peroxynitrite isomerase n=1 Tax=Amycolatopsis antarctica TaxID=1854586 RepID=A0A263CZA5_9PSEU|nr:FABP family protein [Amycolatopsis antarctica]OZM71504.1 FABP family protein [Amycolatopsis antarctica]
MTDGPTSGNEAIEAAEQRSAATRSRNLPQFTDLPIPVDTANLREGADLHEACLALLPLVGVWRGEGEVNYPTIDGPRRFAQQLTIAHDGRPFLYHESRAWLIDDAGEVVRPGARETGWWRPQADDTIELLLAHHTGILELFYGTPRTQTSWELGTDAVIRTSTAKDVNGAKRLYGLVNGDLGWVEERAMMGQSLQPHASAMLTRVVG